MWAAMLLQSETSNRSSAYDAADMACTCILIGMSVSSTIALPSNIFSLCPLSPLPFPSPGDHGNQVQRPLPERREREREGKRTLSLPLVLCRVKKRASWIWRGSDLVSEAAQLGG